MNKVLKMWLDLFILFLILAKPLPKPDLSPKKDGQKGMLFI
jgi:hypothetical protein